MIRNFLFAYLGVSFFSYADVEATNDFFVECTQAKLYCHTMGEGNPLIFVHDGPGISHDYFLPQMAPLASQHRLYFYDQRGGGRSQGLLCGEHMNLDQFVSDLEQVRLATGSEKVSLLGHGWGGLLAMQYAIAHPESVDRLILLGTLPADSTDFALFNEKLLAKWEEFGPKIQEIYGRESFGKGDPEEVNDYNRLIHQMFCLNQEDAEKLTLPVTDRFPLDGLNVAFFFRVNVFSQPYDYKMELAQLSIPTLLIHGVEDPIPVQISEHLNQTISGSQLVEIPNCGHYPFVESPEPFFQSLAQFLEEESK